MMIFRKNEDCIEFLLVAKPRKKDRWQLPQGGIEANETLKDAAMREIHEEAGLTPTYVQQSTYTFQYDFPTSQTYERGNIYKGQIVQFCFGICTNNDQYTLDMNEIVDAAWIAIEKLPLYIVRPEYADCIKNVYNEACKFLPQL